MRAQDFVLRRDRSRRRHFPRAVRALGASARAEAREDDEAIREERLTPEDELLAKIEARREAMFRRSERTRATNAGRDEDGVDSTIDREETRREDEREASFERSAPDDNTREDERRIVEEMQKEEAVKEEALKRRRRRRRARQRQRRRADVWEVREANVRVQEETRKREAAGLHVEAPRRQL